MEKDLLKTIKKQLGDASLGLSIVTKSNYLKLGKEKTEVLVKVQKNIKEARSYLQHFNYLEEQDGKRLENEKIAT